MKLFVLISNNGDGSSSCHFTLDQSIIDRLDEADSNGELDYESIGDGDGFHYSIVEVPDGSTPESLKISVINEDRVNYWITNSD